MKIVLVILLIIMIYIIYFNISKIEQFQEPIYINSIASCGRKIIFPYYRNMNLFVQNRALTDTDNNSLCYYNQNNIDDNNYALIKDDFIDYYIRKKCYSFNNIKSFNIDNNIVSLTIEISDKLEILNFLLLHPLFIEFNFNNDTSLPYLFLNKDNLINFSSNMKTITLYFGLITNGSDGMSFDMKKTSITTSFLRNKKSVSIWIYYTDKIKNNTNYINDKITSVIYTPTGSSLFMDTLRKYYKNNIIPPFTINLIINLKEPLQKKLIAKMLVVNGYYKAGTDDCDNNIFSLMFDDKTNILSLIQGNRNGCGYDDSLSLKVPMTALNITITVSNNQKIMFIYWNDENLDKQFIYVKKMICNNYNTYNNTNTNNINNDFNNIFSSPDKKNMELKDIMLLTSKNVKSVNSVDLGYIKYSNDMI